MVICEIISKRSLPAFSVIGYESLTIITKCLSFVSFDLIYWYDNMNNVLDEFVEQN